MGCLIYKIMKTGKKTYFDLNIVEYENDLIGVLYDDTQNLPCADEFNQWFYGSTIGIGSDKNEWFIYTTGNILQVII